MGGPTPDEGKGLFVAGLPSLRSSASLRLCVKDTSSTCEQLRWIDLDLLSSGSCRLERRLRKNRVFRRNAGDNAYFTTKNQQFTGQWSSVYVCVLSPGDFDCLVRRSMA